MGVVAAGDAAAADLRSEDDHTAPAPEPSVDSGPRTGQKRPRPEEPPVVAKAEKKTKWRYFFSLMEDLGAGAARRATGQSEMAGQLDAARQEVRELRVEREELLQKLEEIRGERDGARAELRDRHLTAALETTELQALRDSVSSVLGDLGLPLPEEAAALPARVSTIPDRVRGMMRASWQTGIHLAFTVVRTYHHDIRLDLMSQEGYADGYTDAEITDIEQATLPLAQALARILEAEDE